VDVAEAKEEGYTRQTQRSAAKGFIEFTRKLGWKSVLMLAPHTKLATEICGYGTNNSAAVSVGDP
jgi:hypothetical protein